MAHDPRSRPPAGGDERPPASRRPWTPPALEELPPLTDLTLQTGSEIEGDGDTGDGGSTVF